MRRSVTQTLRLCDVLAEAMQPSFVGHWLDQPNQMLDNLKPVEAIERGQIDLVWAALKRCAGPEPLGDLPSRQPSGGQFRESACSLRRCGSSQKPISRTR
jgi:hypothetical protein